MNILTRKITMANKKAVQSIFTTYTSYKSMLASIPATSQMLVSNSKSLFSTKSQYYWEDDIKEEMDPQISKLTHKSNAQELINAIPVIEVDGDVARCTGANEFGYGHPVEYIALNTVDRSKPSV